MRHEQIEARDTYDKVDIAAVWPASAQVAPLPVPEIDRPAGTEPFRAAAAAPDVPAGVGVLIVGAYVGLVAAFALATMGSKESVFQLAIVVTFLAAFFTVPRLFLGLEPDAGRRPTLERFMDVGMETLTGRCSGRAALVQMLIVPVLLTLAALAMGIMAATVM